jgi:Bacterial archaeo-eukaryotic release factor family 7
MEIPSIGELRALSERHNGPCISMFLPTHRSGMETQQDQLRLRNHIRAAENRLLLDHLRTTQVEHLLQPIQALLEDESFWLHPGDGLALFRSPDTFRTYWLPSSFQEQVVVTDHFYLKPLLPFLSKDERFSILALSQNEVRLLQATHYSIRKVDLPAVVPRSLAEALTYDEPENELLPRSSSSGVSRGKGGRRATIFHGQGVGIDDARADLLRYVQQVDRGLHELLRDEKAPLVLACVESLFPLYREVNTYPHLLDQAVPGNPDKLSAETLRRQAWAIMEPYLLLAREQAAARYREYIETGRASHNVREIIAAAFHGQVESLFIAIDQEQWGTFHPATNTYHVHRVARYHDDDLLDIAATQTLLHSGSVYAVGQAQVPGGELVAAVFRY